MPTTPTITRPCLCGSHKFALLPKVAIEVKSWVPTPFGVPGLTPVDVDLAMAVCVACGRVEMFAVHPAGIAGRPDAVAVEVPAGGSYR
jgi:hypothetical protein